MGLGQEVTAFSLTVVSCHAQPPVVLPVMVLVGVCKEKTLWSQENQLQKAEY